MAVTNSESKHRTKLNTEQLEILKLLNKFRYGSKELVTQYLGKKDQSYVFRRLEVLLGLGLIAKRYESNYRLLGKPAAYYLTPVGAKLLQESKDIDINMKLIYKNKATSENFVSYCLNIFTARNLLKAKYGDKIRFFTKNDLTSYDYFPQPMPDGYVSLEKNKTEKLFFLNIIDETKPFFTIVKRIKQYIDYDEAGEWKETGANFPAVLFICPSVYIQKRLIKQLQKIEISMIFAITTWDEIQNVSQSDTIWLSDDPDEKISLSLIS